MIQEKKRDPALQEQEAAVRPAGMRIANWLCIISLTETKAKDISSVMKQNHRA